MIAVEIISRAKMLYRMYISHSILSRAKSSKFRFFGENSIIYRPRILSGDFKQISIGNNTTILHGLRMQLYAQSNKAVIPEIEIGDGCYFGFNLSILAADKIHIGNHVLIASDVLIASENHGIDPESPIPYMDQPLIGKPVRIGNNCWIGEKVCILPGTEIGDNCIIGAASVVTKSIPDNCIAVGSPAKVIKKYNYDIHAWEKV